MMINRNLVRSSALSAIVAVTLFSASTIARGSNQKPGKKTEASLLTARNAIPGIDVILKKQPDGQSAGVQEPAPAPSTNRPMPPPSRSRARSAPRKKRLENDDRQSASNKKTDKDGSFSFENVPVGTYNLTFDAPKVSPTRAGKVEYLVIVQQVEAGGVGNSKIKRNDQSMSKTARIPISKIKQGIDFTVGQPTEGTAFDNSQSNSPAVVDPQMKKAKGSKEGNAPRAMNLRGKIFLVEIGTTKIVRDQPE